MNLRGVVGLLLLVEVILETGFIVKLSWVQGFSLKNGLLYGMLLLALPDLLRGGRHLPRPAVYALIAFFLLCGWTAITALWGNTLYSEVGSAALSPWVMVKTLVIDSAVAFLVFCTGMGNRLNYLQLSRWVVIVLAVFCALALVEVWLPGEAIYGASHEMTRNRGPFGEVNQSAGILAMMVPVAVAWATRGNGLSRTVFAVSAALMLGSLLLTGSRGGVVAVVVAVMPVLLLLHREKRFSRRMMLLVALPTVLILAWVALPDAYRLMVTQRLMSLGQATTDVTETSSGRATLWRIAIELWVEKPILGSGWSNYQARVGIPTHNEYLKYLVDSGAVGAVLYMAIWISVLLLVRKAQHSLRADPLIFSAFYGSVLGAMTAVFFVNFYRPGLFLWALIGLIAGHACQVIRAAQAAQKSASALSSVGWSTPFRQAATRRPFTR